MNDIRIPVKGVVIGVSIAIVAIAAFIAFRPLRELPGDICGEYTTTHPKYAGRYLMLKKRQVWIGPDMMAAEVYRIEKVSREERDGHVMYKLDCSRGKNDDFTFSFYHTFENNGTIRLKNQKETEWIRKPPHAPENA